MDAIIYLAGAGLVLALMILPLVIMWRFFEKTNRPGWVSLVPIYNMYTMLKVAGRPGWWLLLFFIPVVNIATLIIVSMDIAAAFKRSASFGIFGLVLFSIIGYAILAFGDETYTQPNNQ